MMSFFVYQPRENFSPLLLKCDEIGLTELLFAEQNLPVENNGKYSLTIQKAIAWLDEYFSGGIPHSLPPLHLPEQSAFQREVLRLLMNIPYGEAITYGEIACILAQRHRIPKMSAQAVGNAVHRNPICILIPCHRVLGKGGRLTGYAGGLHNKAALLDLEGIPYR